MQYQHSFTVQVPLDKVADFHRVSASMAMITLPPILVRIHQAPEILQEGDEMRFTLWLGPLPLRWLAKIENLSKHGFTDRQIEGPFQRWEHQHRFQANHADSTTIIDRVQVEPKKHWFWGLVGRLMVWGLPALFAFRGWKTRQILAAR